MPQPRPTRSASCAAADTGRDDSPENLARIRAELERRLDFMHWRITCVNEARRRLCGGCAPGRGIDLTPADHAGVSLEKIAAGERPPPGLEPDWYPPGHPLIGSAPPSW
ncbi:MAG: hypothetical protein V4707_02825 [Pseudomonadota bacterium]